MKRWIVAIALLWALPARAHVGSPDVFFDGDAGPYHLFVAIRMPKVIPGVATIELRTDSPDVRAVTVVPMRLIGPGSELPPTPDAATRSPADPQFFTADLWLMERGSLQVRVAVTGGKGSGTLRIPVPAAALETKGMDRGLGLLLFACMLVLALAAISIATAAVREAALDPGTAPDPRARRRSRVAMVVAGAGIIGVLALGRWWWTLEASDYASWVQRPWLVKADTVPCRIAVPVDPRTPVLPDHGHDMHLFLVRMPGMDQLAHLHPERAGDVFTAALPSLPAGRYRLYADIVLPSGYPVTGTGELELAEQRCEPLEGDDSSWAAGPGGDVHLSFDRPAHVRAGEALPLKFHADAPALEPYMGMAGHAEIVKTDGSVFAHIHPTGTVAMPALELAQGEMGMAMPMEMHQHHTRLPPDVTFPYGFPSPGDYRVFVQVKHAGQVVTGAFDVHVE